MLGISFSVVPIPAMHEPPCFRMCWCPLSNVYDCCVEIILLICKESASVAGLQQLYSNVIHCYTPLVQETPVSNISDISLGC